MPSINAQIRAHTPSFALTTAMLRLAVLLLALGAGLVNGKDPSSKPSSSPLAIKVACVGDSITAGYLASNASKTYPSRLQAQLDSKYGAGSYLVSNFGAGGATLQKHADSPYWNRSQFAQWVNGTYDIVIMMLGTNDAKAVPVNNWKPACSAPHPTAESCAAVKDYLSLIKLASSLGVGGKTPLVTIMIPPPFWRNGSYGMNNVILNDVMPKLVPQIASAAGLPPPIDVFSALGGTSDWRSTFPDCGCQRPAAAAAAGEGARVSPAAVNWTRTQGVMYDPGFLEIPENKNLTWSEAAAACAAASNCAGFTFRANESKPTAPTAIRLKKCEGVGQTSGSWSWTKPLASRPAPSMPKSCTMFCQINQSCDACHPDDDGYNLLATQVFTWIVKHKTRAAASKTDDDSL